jgi:CheY-like chemotaxis protein
VSQNRNPGDQQGRTVLVVDDEPTVLRVICGILARRGYHVAGAATGQEALEMFDSLAPVDLLLTDVVMPGMSGPQLAERLMGLHPGLRVLFTAGMPDSPDIRRGIFDRGLTLLPKPFLPSQLMAKIEEVLGIPGLSAAVGR